MRFLRAIAMVTGAVLLTPAFACADSEMSIANPPMSYFAPVPTYHNHIFRRVGVLLSYVVGPNYTQAILDDSRRQEWQLVVSGTFAIEGRRVTCTEAPADPEEPATILCPDWPSDIQVYTTPVIFSYWMTTLGNDPIAVLQSIDPVPLRWR